MTLAMRVVETAQMQFLLPRMGAGYHNKVLFKKLNLWKNKISTRSIERVWMPMPVQLNGYPFN
jgi:hypothetical protein